MVDVTVTQQLLVQLSQLLLQGRVMRMVAMRDRRRRRRRRRLRHPSRDPPVESGSPARQVLLQQGRVGGRGFILYGFAN